MNYKLLIGLIGSYILSFSVNVIPAIKYPDLNVGVFHLLVTLVFIILLVTYSIKGSNALKIFSSIGVLSGVLIFVLTTFESNMLGNSIFDLVVSIQYPFYFIFTIPVFGCNLLFDLSSGSYSLLMSLFYGAVFALATYFQKRDAVLA
ncbi:hypothetical protein [Radiobacillus deserti]|uniref:Uncharacterized protein n=1 Tax=Radiobacillus deserti TaxID=2594883 RepID=A0A516KJE4_9BACI|nr:hypothetical protein [Radiobacillus deserti]QDP41509.1 hypothetical protein FN924_15810 [Radiobacillus deserti]